MFKIVTVSDTTREGLKIYRRFKDVFGNVIRAQMKCTPGHLDYELILSNIDEDEMVFRGCFSAGFSGEGPRGTFSVLQDAGFEINEEFIKKYECFDIHK